jgi:hypothetical protein
MLCLRFIEWKAAERFGQVMELDVEGSGYYPVQLPFLLNERFKQNVLYTEVVYPDCSEFAICFWEMEPKLRAFF